MNWERKALEHIIASLVDQDIKFSDFTEKLKGLGIQLNLDGTAYEILRGLTGWQFLAENIEAVKVRELSKEDFVEAGFKYIELGLTDKLKCNHGTSRGFKKHSESDLAYKNINVLGIHTA